MKPKGSESRVGRPWRRGSGSDCGGRKQIPHPWPYPWTSHLIKLSIYFFSWHYSLPTEYKLERSGWICFLHSCIPRYLVAMLSILFEPHKNLLNAYSSVLYQNSDKFKKGKKEVPSSKAPIRFILLKELCLGRLQEVNWTPAWNTRQSEAGESRWPNIACQMVFQVKVFEQTWSGFVPETLGRHKDDSLSEWRFKYQEIQIQAKWVNSKEDEAIDLSPATSGSS